MGVRGLTTYINRHEEAILKTYFLHDCNLIIDGPSLCCQLYLSSNEFSAFGGDYDKFGAKVKQFFKALRKCNITPYVLIDGGYETRKLKTIYSRLRSKIQGASGLDPVTQSRIRIFPLLFVDVFREILKEMNVRYTICEFEADDEIAAMARHLNCPVLSFDSDYFIYNVLYVPFNKLDTDPEPIEENGYRIFRLKCKLYTVENLLKQFGGLKQELLPLLATLLGNDYVQKQCFNKFFSQLKRPKNGSKTNDEQRLIHAMFQWLKNETVESAISKIIGCFKKQDKKRISDLIEKSISGYQRNQCLSLKYFNIVDEVVMEECHFKMPSESNDVAIECDIDETMENKGHQTVDEEENDPDNEETCESDVLNIPDWFAELIRNEQIRKPYINLYTHRLYFFCPQAEDYTDEDSHICTLPIIKFAFDLLTDFNHESFTYVSREKSCNYKRMNIDHEFATARYIEKPFDKLTTEELQQHFKYFINERLPGFDWDSLQLLPSNFQLFMISIIWWIKNCKVSLDLINALFLSYIMLEVVDEKTGTKRGHWQFNKNYSRKLEELKKRPTQDVSIGDKLFLNKNKVEYDDCVLAASILLYHFDVDPSIVKRPKRYDIRKVHRFAQFQCCLMQINFLNNLCREPFESTKIYKSLNGTFMYNLALKLEEQTDPPAYILWYLQGAKTVLMFYKSICKVYEGLVEKMKLSTHKPRSKKNSQWD